MKKYCEECGNEVNTTIVTKKETYVVCGDSIEVDAKVMVCADCGENFYCEDLDNETLLGAYNEYRRRHRLLMPEEIKKIREQYGLSQRSFAKLLNWGDKTIHRYENGAIQDKAHNSLLVFLKDPENMRSYLMENEVGVEEKQKVKILATIECLEQDVRYRDGRKLLNRYFSKIPTIENGFKAFDYEKLCAMVLFFAHKTQGLLKVKLLALLNYADMVFYQENGVSMSGMRYVHLPHGAIPLNCDMIFGMMEADKIIHIELAFEDGYEKYQVIPDYELLDIALTENELEVVERIYKKFAEFGSAEISKYSRGEKGYRLTKQGEIISYIYAKDIILE